MFDKFRIKITILASLIITAYCFFTNTSFLKAGYMIIFTIVIFYILGGIAELKLKSYVEKIDSLKKENQENEENQDLNQEQNEDLNFQDESLDENLSENLDENEQYQNDFYNDMEFDDNKEQGLF